MSNPNTIKIDDIEYVRKDAQTTGNRAVVVVDRGWVFAGDIDETTPGRIRLRRAKWLFRWKSIGFAAAVADPGNGNLELRDIDDVDIPAAAEVFRVPVADSWGL